MNLIRRAFSSKIQSRIFNSAKYKPTDSWTVKPRSANNKSPGSKFFSRPQFSVKYTSEKHLPQSLKIYDIVPYCVTPTKIFTVLWILHVWAIVVMSYGFSMEISKQSMIKEHFGYNSREQAWIVFQSSSLLGYVTKNDNSVTSIGNHLCKILEAEGWQTYMQGLTPVILVEVSLKL